MNAVLVIDKPAGLTSHDVVNRVRRISGQKSVGHLGTLDPAATGILPLVLGNLTRLAQFYTEAEKEYEGVIRFGFSTDTYDAEGEATSEKVQVKLEHAKLEELAGRFRGKIRQVPPPFSAKKIAGVPAYKLARKKKDIHLDPVEIEVHEFQLLEVRADTVKFRARVGSGTYLRSIAHDFGQAAGCGAHLETLRRTRVAEFSAESAYTLEQLAAGKLEECCFPLRRTLPEFPCIAATEEQLTRIRTGRTVNLPEFSRARHVKVFHGQAELVAIVTRVAGTLFHPKIVLASETTVGVPTNPDV